MKTQDYSSSAHQVSNSTPENRKKYALGFRGKRGTPSEQTFRLIVAEVPSEVKKAAEGTSTLDVTLRHVLPVYVAPQTPGGPK